MLQTYRYFTPAHESMIAFIRDLQPELDPSHVLVLPMCVDYHHSGRKRYVRTEAPLTLGWLGSGANVGNLDIVLPALIRLSGHYPLRLVVVSNVPYVREVPFPIVNERWSLASELRLLGCFDIGLSPLPAAAQQRNIGTFKLVQYMGFGLVSVASSLSYTRELIRHGANGFLVECDSDWEQVLQDVLDRPAEYDAIGQEAQRTTIQRHSYESLRPAYAQFLRHVAEGRPTRQAPSRG
jgi:glycosyltransferase involved in cell wall biosynthesis